MSNFIQEDLEALGAKVVELIRADLQSIVGLTEADLAALADQIGEQILADISAQFSGLADALAQKVWADIEPRLAAAAEGVAAKVWEELKVVLQNLGIWESW